MDRLIDTIAAWPWEAIGSFAVFVWGVGFVAHLLVGARVRVSDWWPAWAFFWPIATPLWLAAYPIRRLVRWVRARGVARKSRERILAMHHPPDDLAWFDGMPVWWCGACETEVSERSVYAGGTHGPRHCRCHGPCEIRYTERTRNDHPSDQPRPPEKSAPYVLDTSREIRELRERVEAQDEKMLALENNGNDALYAMSQRIEKLEEPMTKLGNEPSKREPDAPPIDINEYDWHMTQYEQNRSLRSRERDPQGYERRYADIRSATITVRVDEGDRVREYVLVRRLDSKPTNPV